MTIYTLSGIAGSGKTERLIKYASKRLTNNQKTVFVCRSKELCNQTKKRLIDKGICPQKITIIYGDHRNTNPVGKRLLDHVRNCPADTGEILLCTHSAFLACQHWHRPDLWCPLIDEVPQVHTDLSRKLYQNFAFLTDLVEPKDLTEPYPTLRLKSAEAKGVLRSRLDTAMRDEFNKLHKDLIVALLDPNREVKCDSRNWRQVVAGMSQTDTPEIKEQRSSLHLYRFLQPGFLAAFDQPVISAARIEDHLFYRVWQQMGADIRPATHILEEFGDCTADQHDGSRLVLRILSSPGRYRLWSKTYAGSLLSDGRTPREAIRDFCERNLQGETYAFVTNASPDKGDIPSGAIVLGPHCHGLNNFRHIKTIVISSALVPDRHYEAYLGSLGVSKECIYRDIAWITAYQGMMRTALRDGGTDPVTCYIADPFAAQYIQGLFPGCHAEEVACFAEPLPQKRRGPKPKEPTAEQRRVRRNYRDRVRYAARKQARGG